MATTTRIAGSGDWNTASDWSDGAATAAVDAVFPGTTGAGTGGSVTVTGDGPAASTTVNDDAGSGTMAASASTTDTLAGRHAAATLTKHALSRVMLSGTDTLSGGLFVSSRVVELARRARAARGRSGCMAAP